MLLPPIYLASTSPRRRDLLQQMGLEFEQIAANVDESPLANECAEPYVQRLALAKARVGLLHVPPEGIVVAADTTVTTGGELFGKPCDADDARRMLTRLASGPHEVWTAVAVGNTTQLDCTCVGSTVWFRALSAAAIDRYIATGEPFGKAGAYALQGIGGALVDRLEGSLTGVIGLPLAETAALLARWGHLC